MNRVVDAVTGIEALRWPDCLNVRDLSGLSTSGGGRTVAGALIRSDNLDRLTSTGVQAVHAARVSRIVDLRSAWECDRFPSPFSGDPIWHNVPIVGPDTPLRPEADLVDQYTALLDHNPHRVAAALIDIAEAPPGAVVVHCHAGKGRTGIVVALALSLAGVRPAAIAADYVTVGDSTIDVRSLVGAPEADSQLLPELQPLRRVTILSTLDYLDKAYGGVSRYLARGGLSEAQAEAVKARLTE